MAARVQSDPAFAQALLDEAITLFIDGEPETAKRVLRDLVHASVGFESLAEAIHKPAQRLHRMLSASGNPSRSKLAAIFTAVRPALKPAGRASTAAAWPPSACAQRLSAGVRSAVGASGRAPPG